MNLIQIIATFFVTLTFSLSAFAEGPSPLGKWGYFIQDDNDDSIWSLAMEISEKNTHIAVHCEWNGQVDDAELLVETHVTGNELVFESDAIAKGQQGCDYQVFAGPSKYEVTNSSLIFLDDEGHPILVFYRIK